MSNVLQLFWHSEPVDPGVASEQLKNTVGEEQAEKKWEEHLE